MLDWLVIGGGPQGVHAAARLSASWSGVRIAVLDPHERPLHEWTAVTDRVGMTHLRSPVVHHVGLRALALADFAREWTVGSTSAHSRAAFRGRYRRPSLALFNAHARHVVEASRLDSVWTRGRACGIERVAQGWRVETDRGALKARRVVVAIGSSSRLRWPEWVPRGSPWAEHVHDPERSSAEPGAVLVVGSGLSAVQTAVSLAEMGAETGARGGGHVTLLSRHPARVHRFDTDPGWLGPKRMRGFRAEPSPDRRRQLITNARHLGSVTSDTLHALRAAIAGDRLRQWRGEVREFRTTDDGVELTIDRRDGDPGGTRSTLHVRRVLFATGYAADASSPPWIRELAAHLDLPTARCGTPIPDTALQWARGLHLMGPLAELELGPTARNIAGGRRAGDILAVVAERVRPAAVVAPLSG